MSKVDLASQKKVRARSFKRGYGPEGIVDGCENKGGETYYWSESSLNEWVEVDLGKDCLIESMQIITTAGRIGSFDLIFVWGSSVPFNSEASNIKWSFPVAKDLIPPEVSHTIETRSRARYVGIKGSSHGNSGCLWFYSLRVFGHETAKPQPPCLIEPPDFSVFESSINECSLCLESYQDPRVLPCGHSYCFKDLDKIGKAHNTQCPQCDRAFPSSEISILPTNWLALESHATTNSKSKSDCEDCGKGQATRWCPSCPAKLCDRCSDKIHAIKVLQNHQVTNLWRSSIHSVCPHHPEEVQKMHCNKCQKKICQICISDHPNHPIHSIQKWVDERTKKLVALLDPYEQKKESLSKKIGALEEKNRELKRVLEMNENTLVGMKERNDRASVGLLVLRRFAERISQEENTEAFKQVVENAFQNILDQERES